MNIFIYWSAALSLLFLFCACSDSDERYKVTPTKDPGASFGVYIPKDTEDAIVELDKMLPSKLREEMKNSPPEKMIRHHFGLGMWMRNNWGLWQGSRLSRYFNGLGIHHPDDMSAIILDCYWKHLNNLPVKEETEPFKAYWNSVRSMMNKEKR